jgi:hypothetical protein
MLKHPVPTDHMTHIGDITVSFALLESTIQSFVGSLIREHQRIGQIITAELSFSNLRALLISLYLERHGEDEDSKILRSHIKHAAELEGKRNQITHSIWGAGKDADHITRIKTTAKEKHGIRFHFEDVSAEALKAVADDIKNLAEDFQRFQFDLLKKGKIINNPVAKIW